MELGLRKKRRGWELAIEPVKLQVHVPLVLNSTATVGAAAGIGISSTTVNSADGWGGTATDRYPSLSSFYSGIPGAGFYYGQWIEWVQPIGSTSFFTAAQSASDNRQAALMGEIWQ